MIKNFKIRVKIRAAMVLSICFCAPPDLHSTYLPQVLVNTYPCGSASVRSASKATITQMLASFAEKLCGTEENWVSWVCCFSRLTGFLI